MSTEYAAQVAADGPGVLGKPRRATGAEAGSSDPGAAGTSPTRIHPEAQPDALQGWRPVSCATAQAGRSPRSWGASQHSLSGLPPILMVTFPGVHPSSRQMGQARNQKGTVKVMACVICLEW